MYMHPLVAILLLAIFGSVLGLAGGIAFLVSKRLSRNLSHLAIPFAAGVLITTSIIHLIPEAIEQSGNVGSFAVLVAFFVAFFFEEFFANMHHHEGHVHVGPDHGSVSLVLFGDTIHNFIDGIAIAASYMVDPKLGIVVALATFLHEIPHEVGDFGVLLSAGWSKRNTILANLFSALSTVVAAIATYLFVDQITPILGILLAISAGVFLYLGASDFLPDLAASRGKSRTSKWLFVVLGIVVILAVTYLAPTH